MTAHMSTIEPGPLPPERGDVAPGVIFPTRADVARERANSATPDAEPLPAGYYRDRYGRRKQAPRALPIQSAREIAAMSVAAREGDPPAGSPAAKQLRDALESGDFAGAQQIRKEVAELADNLERVAAAQARREKRAKRRGAK